MNRRVAERNIVVLLFLSVLILFSFAQKDTQKLEKLYTEKEVAAQKLALVKSPVLLKR
jgi:hypothetical protein